MSPWTARRAGCPTSTRANPRGFAGGTARAPRGAATRTGFATPVAAAVAATFVAAFAKIFATPLGVPRAATVLTTVFATCFATVGLACLSGCSTAPETGRRQMILLSSSQERALGAEAYGQQLSQSKVVPQGPEHDRIQEIGRRIANASKRRYAEAVQGFAWRFSLVDDPAVNAWMLPGGNSAVFTGLVRFAKSDDEIAVVLGHEAAHAIARHGAERISRGVAAQVVLGAASASGEFDPRLVGATAAAYGALGETAFSRGEESEADHIGLLIAAEAGYDPRAALGFWTRMGASGGAKPPELLSTHPSDETRAARLAQLMPEALRVYRARREKIEANRR